LSIDSKQYLLPWEGTGKTLFKIGVEFNHEHHNISAGKAFPVPNGPLKSADFSYSFLTLSLMELNNTKKEIINHLIAAHEGRP
jgi:hypothetical protein